MSGEADTRRVVDALYTAFLAGDAEGMLALMADDVEVRFLGQATVHGLPAARRFFAFAGGLLRDVDFRIRELFVDGDVGCCVWEETATTSAGEPWENHGVDVIGVRDGRIAFLHENNDVTLVRRHFPPYVDPESA